MIAFEIVEQALMWPNACIGCMNTKGPFLDTHRELPSGFHVYVCDECIQKGAELRGYAEGAEMDALAQVAKDLSDARAELDRATAKVGSLIDERDTAIGERDDARADIEQLSGRVAQLESRIRETAEAELALVAGGVELDDTPAPPRGFLRR